MKSELTSNLNRPAINELADLLFIPSSFFRLTSTQIKKGAFQPSDDNSRFDKVFLNIYPYLSASIAEGIRLYGYYKIIETVAEKLY